MGKSFSLPLSSNLKSFECKSKDKFQFVDEVAENIKKDIQVSKDKIQSHSIHDQDQYFQMILMPEHKEGCCYLSS